jgi:hypothetical protein
MGSHSRVPLRDGVDGPRRDYDPRSTP